MAGEKTKTGNRVRTKVVVKRDQSGAEDIQNKSDTPPKTNHKVKGRTLHPDTTLCDVDAMKETSTAVERGVSGIEGILRSIAKELIKGGIVVAGAASEYASETGEKFKDLVAEAKSDVEKSQTKMQEMDKTEGKDGN